MAAKLGLKAHQLYEEMTALGGKHAAATLGLLAKGLPVYEACFDRQSAISIEARGAIP
jgi:hypothetical protein